MSNTLRAMKKIYVIFLFSLLILTSVTCWEYCFDRQDVNSWVSNFEKQLHKKELEADNILNLLKDSVEVIHCNRDKDLIFLGFDHGKLFFWTNKIVGEIGLYEKLQQSGNFININNTFYEVRRLASGDKMFFALLHIKDDYPYTNKFVQNHFGRYLQIGIENSDKIDIKTTSTGKEPVVQDKEGNKLFYITHHAQYKDRSVNYVLITCYLLFFLSLFYLFNCLMKEAPSLRRQSLYVCGFLFLLWMIRYVMLRYNVPDSVYRLSIFDRTIPGAVLVSSVGDLFLTSFCICQILFITFINIKIDYSSKILYRYRYVYVSCFVVLSFLYLILLNYSIISLTEDDTINLNIARIIDVDIPSVVAFISIIIIGLGLIVIMDSAVNSFKNFISLHSVLIAISVTMCVLSLLSLLSDFVINFGTCIFLWGVYLLLSLNIYTFKKDVQQTLYILVMFFMSGYIVFIAKTNTEYKELAKRAEYATVLIEERDYNFEEKLREIDAQIKSSEPIIIAIADDNESMLHNYLTPELLGMEGFNYNLVQTLCREQDSLLVEPDDRVWGCRTYFGDLIQHSGVNLEGTDFYSVMDFDGVISYIGCFKQGETTLYLRFDSESSNEGAGYPEILSRESSEMSNVSKPYSYAKYVNGELVFSSGDFNYYKSLQTFGQYDGNIGVIWKGRYSHLVIPVNKSGVFVMSLHESAFSFYYMNILYAFFISILLSSYGLFWGLRHNTNLRQKTLKARIKNNIVALIFVLFVILTAMSIYLNMRSFEARHKAKATELLKFVNKELEQLACVDARECPDINMMLSEMSNVLRVDINIYSSDGELVAMSRPEIFSTGFEGVLANPDAIKTVIKDGAMTYIANEKIGELRYMSAYMPMMLDNNKLYLLNVPYFTQNDDLNLSIIIMVIIAINIAIVVMALAFILSGFVAERVTKPLQMVNDKLKQMRFWGKNEKIIYDNTDEVGDLVKEYNNMVDKLDDSIRKLAKSERESAWREMARQIAHEIKNPLTPMKLNIQFMQRSLQMEDPEKFKARFKDIADVLIEQIDNMASIASTFSDFAKISTTNSEIFDLSEMTKSCVLLFKENVAKLEYEIEPNVHVFADKEQIYRVFVNILKNAEQSIPEIGLGFIFVKLKQENKKIIISIKDNGVGIPDEIREKIFEPNFTTKSSGTGLGLAISRKIIESMNGTVSFIRNPEGGTQFIIVLNSLEV